jgi:hypothetical protein
LREAAVAFAQRSDKPTEILRRFLFATPTRVQVHADRVDVDVDLIKLAEQLLRDVAFETPRTSDAASHEEQVTRLTIPTQLKRTGKELKFVIEDDREETVADTSLIRLLARAHQREYAARGPAR